MTPVARHAHGPHTSHQTHEPNEPDDQSQVRGHTSAVSERNEGRPIAEWIVAIVVALAAVLAAMGFTGVGIGLFALVSFCLAGLRLVLKERSPWKVRSVGFDFVVCLGLGIGLVVTYLSILFIL
ncbi:hypothetical protein KIMH_07910 [Bombiscardovia apis]|uniref:Rod shape-determining protein RodA n=1 Tax=Bombiscardovia apis TaxID=2932182 RepID=A0ABM8BCQ7_9BIFI|nr:DUF3017 domain-containing protein [Bombiscardovia apis]BDR54680.1 hypothetical protein KIMH_07910 [Bombiscardovia apis]